MIKIITDYKTHKCSSDFEETDYFCPNCGQKSIYEDQGEGDYYVGSEFFCVKCKSFFTFQGVYERKNIEIIDYFKSKNKARNK